jgi:hypothetical protein
MKKSGTFIDKLYRFLSVEKTFYVSVNNSEGKFVELLKSISDANNKYDVTIDGKKVKIEKRKKMIANGGFSDWAIAEVDLAQEKRNGKSNKIVISYNPYLKLVLIIAMVLPIVSLIKETNFIVFIPFIILIIYLPFLAGIFIAREQFEKIINEATKAN